MLFSCKKEDEDLDLKYEVLNHIISNEENNLDKNNGMNHVYNIKVIKVSFPENKQIENNLENFSRLLGAKKLYTPVSL